MASSKMNNKLGCFIRTIRQMQACHSEMRPCSGMVVRTYALETKGHESTVRSLFLRQCPMDVSSSWLRASAQSFSQNTFILSSENTSANEQRAADGLVKDQTQNSRPVNVDLNRPPPSFTVAAETDRSAGEETGERSMSQRYFDDIQKCISACDILDMVAKYPISARHASNSLARMWILTKKLPEEQKHYERQMVFEHPQFSQLCQCVMQEAPSMWREDLVYSLHSLVKFGVPQNTRLIQTLLRVCQERLNELDDRSLSVIASTLQGMEECKNVEALRLGLQMLVVQRIPKISNLFVLQTLMKCIGEDSPPSLKTKLETQVLSQIHQLTLQNAYYMFSALAEMKYRSLPILNASSKKIIDNIEGIPFWQMLNILRSCSDLLYRNITLFSTMADFITSTFNMWDTKQVVLFLSAFDNLNFRHTALMDAFAERVISCPSSLILKAVIIVLRAYSNLNHLPEHRDQQFLEALNGALTSYLPRISSMDLLRTVYSFCILGYLPQPALDHLLQDEVLRNLTSGDGQNTEQNKMMLLAVNACLALESPSASKPAGAFSAEKRESSSPLSPYPVVQEVLLMLLGDASLFRPNVKLSHGYNIDFEILIDASRRKLVPYYEADQPADYLSIQRVAVLCFPGSSFCQGSRHPRGRVAMKIRHLRLLGYHVVLVHYPEFQKLKKDEAIQFLKGEIFSSEKHLSRD